MTISGKKIQSFRQMAHEMAIYKHTIEGPPKKTYDLLMATMMKYIEEERLEIQVRS